MAQVNLERVSCKNEDCADERDDAADDFGDDIGLFAARKQLSGDDAGRIDEDCAQHEQAWYHLASQRKHCLKRTVTGANRIRLLSMRKKILHHPHRTLCEATFP